MKGDWDSHMCPVPSFQGVLIKGFHCALNRVRANVYVAGYRRTPVLHLRRCYLVEEKLERDSCEYNGLLHLHGILFIFKRLVCGAVYFKGY